MPQHRAKPRRGIQRLFEGFRHALLINSSTPNFKAQMPHIGSKLRLALCLRTSVVIFPSPKNLNRARCGKSTTYDGLSGPSREKAVQPTARRPPFPTSSPPLTTLNSKLPPTPPMAARRQKATKGGKRRHPAPARKWLNVNSHGCQPMEPRPPNEFNPDRAVQSVRPISVRSCPSVVTRFLIRFSKSARRLPYLGNDQNRLARPPRSDYRPNSITRIPRVKSRLRTQRPRFTKRISLVGKLTCGG